MNATKLTLNAMALAAAVGPAIWSIIQEGKLIEAVLDADKRAFPIDITPAVQSALNSGEIILVKNITELRAWNKKYGDLGENFYIILHGFVRVLILS